MRACSLIMVSLIIRSAEVIKLRCRTRLSPRLSSRARRDTSDLRSQASAVTWVAWWCVSGTARPHARSPPHRKDVKPSPSNCVAPWYEQTVGRCDAPPRMHDAVGTRLFNYVLRGEFRSAVLR